MKVRWMLAGLLSMALLPALASPRPAVAQDGPPPPHDMDRDHDRDHDWDHDPRFEGHNPGYRQGFRDGFGDGRNDREAGRRWHYGLGYKHPDRGYRGEFGDKEAYKHEYKEAYEQGYREGFGDRH